MPAPYPYGGSAQIQPSPSHAPGVGSPASTPEAANVPGFGDGPGGGFNDNWADLAWMPSPEESRLNNDIDTAKLVLGIAVRGIGINLAYRGLKYSWDNAWDPLLSALNPLAPFGAERLQGFDLLCGPFAMCGSPWQTSWTGSGPHVCTTLCTSPTTLIPKSQIASDGKPWGWPGVNQWSKISWQSATALNAYIRVKEDWRPKTGYVVPQDYLRYNRLKPDPGLLPEPFPIPGRIYQPAANPLRNLDPWTDPIGDPLTWPAALPFNYPRPSFLPGTDPAFQPRKWESPRPRVSPVEAPYSPLPGIWVVPDPNGQPSIVVTPVAGVRPGTNRGVNAKGRSSRAASPKGRIRHKNAKPGRGVRERKPKDTKLYNAAKALMNGVTETGDVIDAAWNALDAYHPKGSAMHGANGWQTRVKGKQTSYPQKLKDLYKAFGDPKFNEAQFAADFAVGLAKNEAGDRAGGAIGKQTKAANKRGAGRKGLNLGVAYGPAL